MAAPGPHFIVVDDDRDMRNLLRRVVWRQFPSATISEASDGQHALEKFEAGGADVVVVDHLMPTLDGVQFVRALRSRNSTIPLVMVSSNPGVKDEALAAGANYFVDKSRLIAGLIEAFGTLFPATKA